jgi:hypothetical protein
MMADDALHVCSQLLTVSVFRLFRQPTIYGAFARHESYAGVAHFCLARTTLSKNRNGKNRMHRHFARAE